MLLLQTRKERYDLENASFREGLISSFCFFHLFAPRMSLFFHECTFHLILEGREEGRVLLRKGENEEDGLVFAFLLFF